MCKVGERVPLPGPVADIYKAVEELTKRCPGRPFTADGHFVGSIGEVIAKEAFGDGFELVRPSTPGHDATCSVRGEVQIKITAGKTIALRGPCKPLVVFRIIPRDNAAVLVFGGLSDELWKNAGPIRPNGQRTVSLNQRERRKWEIASK